ncbi:MAG: MFS transporter [Oligoflexia bacterium]|nr:MFS transporter [Oligoflexia bacterium]
MDLIKIFRKKIPNKNIKTDQIANRHSSPRFNANFQGVLKVLDKNIEFQFIIQNISLGGAKIRTSIANTKIPIDSEVDIAIYISNNKQVLFQGKILRLETNTDDSTVSYALQIIKIDKVNHNILSNLIKKLYDFWRPMLFFSIYLSYITFYLCRKNISVGQGPMAHELGFTNTQLGLLGSTLYVTYAVGKWINGMLTDNVNIRIIQPLSLFLSGIFNIGLVFFANMDIKNMYLLLYLLAFCWGLNGVFQSGGYAPCIKTLTYWFSNKERGFKWSIWFTSHQTGTWLATLLSGFLFIRWGWQSVFYIPGIIAIVVGILLVFTLRDRPTSIGLPNVEQYHENSEEIVSEKSKTNIKEYFQTFKDQILLNNTIWLVALSCLFLYIVRYGTIDWLTKFMVEVKQYKINQAAYKLSLIPLFGVIAPVVIGYIANKFFKGKNVLISILALVCTIIAIVTFKCTNNWIIEFMALGLLGSAVTVPMIFIENIFAAQCAEKKFVGAVTGFVGMFANLGSVLSSVGTGLILDKYGWNATLGYWIFAATLSILFTLPLLKIKIKS